MNFVKILRILLPKELSENLYNVVSLVLALSRKEYETEKDFLTPGR